MGVVRETVRLGLAARAQAKLKVRQPLRAAVVVATGAEREAIERFEALVREELNVRELRFVSRRRRAGRGRDQAQLPDARAALRKQMPLVAAAVAALDAGPCRAALRDGGTVGISIGGQDHQLRADDLMVTMKPLAGYQVEREGSHAVALELAIDDELRAEGWARDIVRAVQRARQEAGLEVSDRIVLTLDGDDGADRRRARAPGVHRGRDVGGGGALRRTLTDVEPARSIRGRLPCRRHGRRCAAARLTIDGRALTAGARPARL